MKLVGAISTAVLTLTLGVGIQAYAQQDQHDQQEENKPAQEKENKAKPEKSAKPEETNARPEENKNTKPEQNQARQEENKNAKPEENNARPENNSKEQKNAQEQRGQEAAPGRQEQHASGNGNGRIPDDRYRAHFGEQHRFRVTQSDYSNRRFQYGGYWFGFQGAWPSNWLYTQDVYVVEIDGVYYLCNANYPGVNILLSVTL